VIISSFAESMNAVKSLLSIAYFPPISYFLCLSMGKHHLVEAHENYIKQSYRNRMVIFGANGPMSLTVPVVKKSNSKSLINEICIGYHEDWQAQHWKSICSAYQSSPYFEYYKDDLETFFTKKYITLWELNISITNYLIGIMGLDVKVYYSEAYMREPVEGVVDRRNEIHPKKEDGLEVYILEYWQVFADQHGFKSNLSILDLLCNEGPNAENFLKRCIEKMSQ